MQWYGGGEHNGQIFPGVFQGARNGKYLFGLPTARALKLSHDVALIDDALWKGDPAALNAEFKRLVDEARAEVDSQKVAAAPRKTAPVQRQAKTSIGKVVIEKQDNLLLMIELALPAIQAEIEAQEKERPNSEEAIAKRDQIIAILRSMQEKHLALKNAVIDFPAGNISESKLVEVESEFWKPFRSFWSEKGSGLIENLTSMTLFLGGVGIATAIGADPLTSAVVTGVIAGGRPVAQALKAVIGSKQS